MSGNAKSTKELVAELRLFNHHTAADRLEAVQKKLDEARERFDEIETALERWRIRDGQMRSGDVAKT